MITYDFEVYSHLQHFHFMPRIILLCLIAQENIFVPLHSFHFTDKDVYI